MNLTRRTMPFSQTMCYMHQDKMRSLCDIDFAYNRPSTELTSKRIGLLHMRDSIRFLSYYCTLWILSARSKFMKHISGTCLHKSRGLSPESLIVRRVKATDKVVRHQPHCGLTPHRGATLFIDTTRNSGADRMEGFNGAMSAPNQLPLYNDYTSLIPIFYVNYFLW